MSFIENLLYFLNAIEILLVKLHLRKSNKSNDDNQMNIELERKKGSHANLIEPENSTDKIFQLDSVLISPLIHSLSFDKNLFLLMFSMHVQLVGLNHNHLGNDI